MSGATTPVHPSLYSVPGSPAFIRLQNVSSSGDKPGKMPRPVCLMDLRKAMGHVSCRECRILALLKRSIFSAFV